MRWCLLDVTRLDDLNRSAPISRLDLNRSSGKHCFHLSFN